MLGRLQAALGDAYRLDRELGGGGMSRVFVAEEVALGRKVVVKVLPPEMGASVGAERFRREIQLGVPPQRVDVLTSISGVPGFGDAWTGRLEVAVAGRQVPFLGREALVANKRAAGRLKDLADLEALGESAT